MPVSCTRKIGDKTVSLTLSFLKYYFIMDAMAQKLVRAPGNSETPSRAAAKTGAKI